MEQCGQVMDIDRFSTHDGPGIRTAIFLQGCPLRCRWCHSPESQSCRPVLLYQAARCIGCGACIPHCPAGALRQHSKGIRIDRSLCTECFSCTAACPAKALYPSSKQISLDQIKNILWQDRPFYRSSGGGVTVSGGEPLEQPAFTLAILRLCRSMDIHCILETSGYGNGRNLEAMASTADLLYYDIKLLDRDRHHWATGVDNRLILGNLSRLCALNGMAAKIVVRIPCIPHISDSEEQILETVQFARGLGIRRLEPLPYNPMAQAKYDWVGRRYPLDELPSRPKEHISLLRERVLESGMEIG